MKPPMREMRKRRAEGRDGEAAAGEVSLTVPGNPGSAAPLSLSLSLSLPASGVPPPARPLSCATEHSVVSFFLTKTTKRATSLSLSLSPFFMPLPWPRSPPGAPRGHHSRPFSSATAPPGLPGREGWGQLAAGRPGPAPTRPRCPGGRWPRSRGEKGTRRGGCVWGGRE